MRCSPCARSSRTPRTSRSRSTASTRSSRCSPPGSTRSCSTTSRSTQLREGVALIGGRAIVEASGNVNLSTVRAIAETGVDVISVGALTHSVRSLDLGLDVVVDDAVIYLDAAATSAGPPRGARGDVAVPDGRLRQPVEPPHGRRVGRPCPRRRAGAGGGVARLPRLRGRVHLGRDRSRQPRDQGDRARAPARPPHRDDARSSTRRCSRRSTTWCACTASRSTFAAGRTRRARSIPTCSRPRSGPTRRSPR